MVQEKNFWLTTAEMPCIEPHPLPERVDVAILGAGFTGLSAARTLAKRGARVAVLESRTLGWGASSRNGGMVLTGLKLGATDLLSRYGKEPTQRMFSASLEAISTVEKIVAEEKIDCAFSRCGHLEVANKPGHFDSFQQSAEVMARELGHNVRIVPRSELSTEIGSKHYFGGLVDALSAGVNPARYVAGLGAASIRAGAEIHEQTHVDSIEAGANAGNSGWKVSTSRGALWARDVLVATSGYTSGTTPSLRRRIIPIGSYIIVTEVLPEALATEASPRNRMIYNSLYFTHYYRLTPDHRMLFGGRAAFFPENENTIRESQEILRRDMIEIFPQLRETKIEYVWGGTLDFAFDMMPHAGKMDGLYYSVGYAGHGVAMATLLGQRIAERIVSGDTAPEANPFSEIPFKGAPLGLYRRNPWFLPLAGMWFRFLDLIS
ncbi:MAG: FAD-binding oxidoreductase [Acidobacteria bacterium]|nr:FAD-binding oxidoreductase [Acidobacteriota bacterium]MBS1867066.1 FAD-binding oxidoreductase [Acidobacteriota bacterium]